jgi:nucleotide-binding universal stress UspA family protein
VVGSQGRSALGRLILGSVSQNVLSYAPCSVRVGRTPPAAVTSGGVRVLLGVDGSADSALAVEAVAARVWPAGTEVRVVTALDPRLLGSVTWFGAGMVAIHVDDDGGDVRTMLGERVEEVAGELRGAGLAVTTRVADGDPKRVLVEEAERWGAHAIFLGARGHTRVQRLLLGSVSAAVATRARCSVEVVRAVM